MKAIGYISVNTLSQRPKNYSLREQAALIADYIAAQGWEAGRIYREVISADDPEAQPALDEIIAAASEGAFGVVVVTRLDRLTRDIRKLNTFISTVCLEGGVELVSMEEGLDTRTESGALALRIIDIVTKWDTKRISDRTRGMIAHKRTKGERVGHAPYGYAYRDKVLVEVPQELKTVRQIRAKREEGHSYHRIARQLNEAKVASKRGGIWYAETVKSVYLHALAGDHPAAAG